MSAARPETCETPLGRFLFRHLRPDLLFGYALTEVAAGRRAFVASTEKALLDLLYLTPGADRRAFLEELRFERPDDFDWNVCLGMASRFGRSKLARAVSRLRKLSR